ncbi:MFS transporter [Pseudomonas sp. Fig-3]|uniref:MFS transporter n=1 Tax=unclassified Pseudomonas TaxID=196821 RepID=UPI001112394C|nr:MULTISPECIES: MFS transporter [unclassified Pseudomonas]TNB81496.1 MFS transporter [Pseudomonas sp. Fig-3]
MHIFKIDSNVARLAIAQALAGANSTVVYATGAIIGNMLAPRPSLATLPISVFVIGMALATLPIGYVGRRFGRRVAFLIGNACGVIVGLLAAYALWTASFGLFCIAMLFGGAYAAVVLTFRFAAAECVDEQSRARALSMVLAGGVAAGVLGPQLVNATMDVSPHTFAITYIAAAGFALLSAWVLLGVRFIRPAPTSVSLQTRPVGAVIRQPRFIVAMLCGVVSYMMMNFIMTSAPLAMDLCGITRVNSNFGIEMHVIAMYAPSFFTGRLINRFGAPFIIQCGLVLIGAAALAGMAGMSIGHFWLALVLLGIGWNFGFLGASALVLTCHAREDGPRVQAINDFVVFGTMVVGSFLSGGLLDIFGWSTVSGMILPPVLIAMGGLFWLQSRQRNLACEPRA